MKPRTVLLIVLMLVVVIFVATFIGSRLFIAGRPNLIRNGSFETGNYKNDPPMNPQPMIPLAKCGAGLVGQLA